MIELRYPEIQDAEAFYDILKEFDFPYYYAAKHGAYEESGMFEII